MQKRLNTDLAAYLGGQDDYTCMGQPDLNTAKLLHITKVDAARALVLIAKKILKQPQLCEAFIEVRRQWGVVKICVRPPATMFQCSRNMLGACRVGPRRTAPIELEP